MSRGRERIDVDVLFVGAGPASLSGALRLAQLVSAHNQLVRSEEQLNVSIAVLEKGREVGAHSLSGAILDPRALAELIPNFEELGAPLDAPVREDQVWFLTEHGRFKFPVVPPSLRNHGNYVISLGRLVRWLASLVEGAGVDIFPEFPAAELLIENDQVVGVRTTDRGVNKSGQPKPNYEPGVEIRAKVTVLGEGPRGSLTKQLIERFQLDRGKNPQVYSIGIKELWEVPNGRLLPGTVIHTLGFPLDSHTFGGGFIYGGAQNQVSIGLVVGLSYENPTLDPHAEFQRWKTHDSIRAILQGGKLIRYGAKALPEGGLYSIPQPYTAGSLIIGDSAGFLNSQRLKGIHLAMKSGMLAAETIFQAILANDFSSERLSDFDRRIRRSWLYEELYRVRNFHQAMEKGLWVGSVLAGLQFISGGRGIKDPMVTVPGHRRMRKLAEYRPRGNQRKQPVRYDGTLTFDKLSDVFYSGTSHDEDQPCHLRIADFDICHNRCPEEYGNPCQYFCPASVYEMVEVANGRKRLQINASNCVHCKTCDIMDPYQIITWIPPEGGGGPNYLNL